MRLRPTLVPVLATLALMVGGAAPALGAGAGSTFLAGGIPLPAGALPGGAGGSSDGEPDPLSVSANGRYVAFAADADLLDPGADPDVSNIFRKDRLTGEVVLVSRANGAGGEVAHANGHDAVISADGTRVAWRTTAALDPADTDAARVDVYVRDIPSGTTLLASQGNGGAQVTDGVGAFDLSGDGRWVAFDTATGLAGADDTTGDEDVYRRDLQTGTTQLVSVKSGATTAANDASNEPAISDDGRWVAFTTFASDLVSGFLPGGVGQIVARDMNGAGAFAVSNQSGTLMPSNGDASEPTIAGAPTTSSTVTVAYSSSATDLDGADASNDSSVYRRQLSDPGSTLVSRADGVTGGDANADADADTPSISDDGGTVVFDSDATDLGAGDDGSGTYVRDVGASRTALVSADNRYAVEGQIAGDGGTIAWLEGGASTPDSDADLPGVFARSYAPPTTLGPISYVSRPAGGAPFLAPAFEVPDPDSGLRTMSADGRYLVFDASSTRLPGAVPFVNQLYRRDLLTGATELVSRADGPNGAPAADGFDESPSISADGTRVAFASSASNLAPGHTGASDQIYVRDLAAGTTTLVSRASDGSPADRDASVGRMSADGRHVAFVSQAANLGAGAPGTEHVYLRDLATGVTQLVDRASGAGGAIGNAAAEDPSVSGDGRVVAFGSDATNLDPADADGDSDAYVRDTVAQTTTLVSRRSGASGADTAGSFSVEPSVSTDGRVVAYRTGDETLAPEGGPWGGREEIVARTLATAQNALVSRAQSGAVADGDADSPAVNGDGSVIAFGSDAANLLPGRGGGNKDAVFARTTATGSLSGPPAFGPATNANLGATFPTISDDGQCMLFTGRGHNAATGFAGDFRTLYVYVVSGSCPKPPAVVVTSGRRTARAPKPTLARASLSHKRFRVGRARTAKSAGASASASVAAKRRAARRRARRAPVGTTFRFTLNTRANVAIAIERPAPGRLSGRFCRRPSHRLRRHLRCVRWVRVGSLSRGGVRAGRVGIAFSGRIGRKALRPGSYRARLRAGNGTGVSNWTRLSFRVVRR